MNPTELKIMSHEGIGLFLPWGALRTIGLLGAEGNLMLQKASPKWGEGTGMKR